MLVVNRLLVWKVEAVDLETITLKTNIITDTFKRFNIVLFIYIILRPAK